jgi:hypothetical protein
MAMPTFSYAANVAANISICTLIAPIPWVASGSPPVPNKQLTSEVFDLASYYILAGSTGVGTVVTFQELRLDTSTAASPQWVTLTTGGSTSTPLTITLASSTPYGGVLNGPFHGLQMTISGVVGNGIAYARISTGVRMT